MARLFYNQDCTDFFYNTRFRPGQGAAALDRFVEVLAGAGIDVLLCNTNAQLVNYASDVWQTFWDGFAPDAPDDQPLLRGLAGADPQAAATWRQMIANMRQLHAEGVDYPARMLERSRAHGVSPWISLRMNDVHNNDQPDHPIHSRFWREHPQYYRRGVGGYFSRAFDFAHPQVRDHYLRLVDESLERYDLDGLELDFLREPYLFSRGEERRGGAVLAEWMAQVRERVSRQARRRGHRIELGVRVPSRPAAGLALGLDAAAWARAGLVDVVVVAPRWASIEFDMPLPDWRELLSGSNALLLGGLEILLGVHPAAPKRPVTAAEARGAALQVLAGGADGVYLFNFFPPAPDAAADAADWRQLDYAGTLRSLADTAQLVRLPRRHVLTYCDVTGPEGANLSAPALPATGSDLEFLLPTGRPAGATAGLTVVLGTAPGHGPLPPTLTVNGQPAIELEEDAVAGDGRRLRYRVPAGCLREGLPNRIALSSRGGPPLAVQHLHIDLDPGPAAD